jgi:hypothetical protein
MEKGNIYKGEVRKKDMEKDVTQEMIKTASKYAFKELLEERLKNFKTDKEKHAFFLGINFVNTFDIALLNILDENKK